MGIWRNAAEGARIDGGFRGSAQISCVFGDFFMCCKGYTNDGKSNPRKQNYEKQSAMISKNMMKIDQEMENATISHQIFRQEHDQHR